MTGDMLALAVGKCTVNNSHVFSSSHCGYPTPGYGPGTTTYVFTPFFQIGSFAFTKPMLVAIKTKTGFDPWLAKESWPDGAQQSVQVLWR